MKIFFALLCAFFLCATASAQNGFSVKGRVINDVTKEPMRNASVFAQNTTTGTVTDENGNFRLTLPAGGYDLVVTYTGYQTESKRVTSSEANDELQYSLRENEKELLEVSVVASNEVKDGLEKYGSFFRDEFVGKTLNSANCKIQNPEVLKFFFSKKRNRLKITAAEPLVIANNSLGYNIKYSLDSFTHEYATSISTYTGYPLFEEMTPANESEKLQWAEARREAYRGSVLHFMRSLYNRDLNNAGFEIQFLVSMNGRDNAIKLKDPYAAMNYERNDSTQTVELMPNQSNAGIIYKKEKPSPNFLKENPGEPSAFQFSTISFKPGESIVIERNGYFYDQNDIAFSGYWIWDKVADQLPYDYQFLSE